MAMDDADDDIDDDDNIVDESMSGSFDAVLFAIESSLNKASIPRNSSKSLQRINWKRFLSEYADTVLLRRHM